MVLAFIGQSILIFPSGILLKLRMAFVPSLSTANSRR